jgi:hypothetical protein
LLHHDDRRSGGPGLAPSLSSDAESVSRARERQVAYGPDGRVRGVRERELWTVVRRPGLPPAAQASGSLSRWLDGLLLAILGLWAQLADLWWFCFGHTLILGCAVAGGYLARALGWSAAAGYFGVLALIWFGFVRRTS